MSSHVGSPLLHCALSQSTDPGAEVVTTNDKEPDDTKKKKKKTSNTNHICPGATGTTAHILPHGWTALEGLFNVPLICKHIPDEPCDMDILAAQQIGTLAEAGSRRSHCVKELEIHQQLMHPNIVTVFPALSSPFDIVMERCWCDLQTVLAANSNGRPPPSCQVPFPESVTQTLPVPELNWITVVAQVLSALSYIHSQGFAHLDVKVENILWSFQGCWKLCDFGSAQNCFGEPPLFCRIPTTFTEQFAPPEMQDVLFQEGGQVKSHGLINGPAADVWMVGMLLLCLVLDSKTSLVPLSKVRTASDMNAPEIVSVFAKFERRTRFAATTGLQLPSAVFAFYPKSRVSCNDLLTALQHYRS